MSRRLILAGLAAVLVLTTAVYSSSFQNAFLNWDDPVNVTQNTAIREISAENVRVWFSEPLLGMYSPLVYASFAIDYKLRELTPFIYHATNLELHLVCVLLVFAIVRWLTAHSARGASEGAGVAALLAAAIFAVHPANVAAVTPISVRSSLLYAAFYLAAYRAYLWHLERPSAARLGVSFLLFLASGLSKSAAAVFPVLLVITDLYRGRALTRASVLEKVPFLVAAFAIGGATLFLRGDIATGDPLQTTWLERAALAGFQLGRYALTAIAPVGLSPFYPYPQRVDGALPAMVFVAPLLLIGAAVLIARTRSLGRPLLFAAAFFVLHLALVLKIVPMGEEFTADRYLYLPIIGLCLAGVELTRRLEGRGQHIALALALVVIALFSVQSYRRSADWRDDMTFNSRILEHYPRSATALANRAAARLQAGDVDGAHQDSTEAIRSDVGNARAYYNRALAGVLLGRLEDAQADVNRAIEIDPSFAPAFELRAQVRLNRADHEGARDDADRAIAMAPEASEVFKSYVTRGLARAMLGDRTGALADLDRAIALTPGELALVQNRGQVRIMFGNVAAGCADLRYALANGRQEVRPLVDKSCR